MTDKTPSTAAMTPRQREEMARRREANRRRHQHLRKQRARAGAKTRARRIREQRTMTPAEFRAAMERLLPGGSDEDIGELIFRSATTVKDYRLGKRRVTPQVAERIRSLLSRMPR